MMTNLEKAMSWYRSKGFQVEIPETNDYGLLLIKAYPHNAEWDEWEWLGVGSQEINYRAWSYDQEKQWQAELDI